jgi:ribosomal protein S18 acetylase RimI-like enzyme
LVRIREVEAGDSVAWGEIVTAGWRWAYRGIISDEELAKLDVVSRSKRFDGWFVPNELSLAAVDEFDAPVGFAFGVIPSEVPNFEAEITALYVDPAKSRLGIGRSLVTEMVSRFRLQEKSSMAIHTLQANRIGRGFYESIGGVVVLEDEWNHYPAVWYGWTDLSAFGK